MRCPFSIAARLDRKTAVCVWIVPWGDPSRDRTIRTFPAKLEKGGIQVQRVTEPTGFCISYHPGLKMAAQGGIRDKILRVSMPFEKGTNTTRKLTTPSSRRRPLFGNLSDSWAVVLKVRSWALELKEGRVRSCAEIARREGITRARVSQLWSLSEITSEQSDKALTGSKGREISLRRFIQIARNPDEK